MPFEGKYKPSFNTEELSLPVDLKSLYESTPDHPGARLVYELLRSDPQFSGQLEALELLASVSRFRGENLGLEDSVDELSSEDFPYQEEYKKLLLVGRRKQVNKYWDRFILDEFAYKTAELSSRILAVMVDKKALPSQAKYWIHYTLAHAKTCSKLGTRPQHEDGFQKSWDVELAKQIHIQEIFDESENSQFESNISELIKQIDALRAEIIRQTILDIFPQAQLRIGLSGIQNHSWEKISIFTKLAPLTLEQFRVLTVVPAHFKDPSYVNFRFFDNNGQQVHLAVYSPSRGNWVDLNQYLILSNLAVPNSGLSNADQIKIDLLRAGQERYFRYLKHFLQKGDYLKVIDKINALFLRAVHGDVESSNRQNRGLVHDYGLNVLGFSMVDAIIEIGGEDLNYFYERDMEAAGKPRLLDQFDPSLLEVKYDSRHKDANVKPNTISKEMEWPKSIEPMVISKPKIERLKKEKIFRVISARPEIESLVKFLDVPGEDLLNGKFLKQVRLGIKVTDVTIISLKSNPADGKYLRLAAPLWSTPTEIKIGLELEDQVLDLSIGKDFEIVSSEKTGHLVIELKQSSLFGCRFSYSLGVNLAEISESPQILLEPDALLKVARVLSDYGYSVLSQELSIFSKGKNLSLAALESLMSNASFYTYNDNYTYLKNIESDVLKGLSGFLDDAGKLHFQCDGAAWLFSEIVSIYNQYAKFKLESRGGTCIKIADGTASLADFHVRNYVAANGMFSVKVDTTPWMEDNESDEFDMGGLELMDSVSLSELQLQAVLQQTSNDLKSAEELITEVSNEYLRLLSNTFNNRFPAIHLRRGDPIFTLQAIITGLIKNELTTKNALGSLSSMREVMHKFTARTVESPSLLKKYPHYANVNTSYKVIDLIEALQEFVRAKYTSPDQTEA